MSKLKEHRRRLLMLILCLFGVGLGVFFHLCTHFRQTLIVEDREIVLVHNDEFDTNVILGTIICGAFSIYYMYLCWNPPSDP